VRKSLDEGFGDEFGLETKAASDDEKNEAAGAAPPPATVAKAPVSLGFGSAAQGAPAVNGAAKVASSALPKVRLHTTPRIIQAFAYLTCGRPKTRKLTTR
jgi:hypothetical protein